MDLPVRNVREAQERLMATPGGKELMAHYVALEDIETIVCGCAGVGEPTKRRVMDSLRSYARGCDVVPYYLFTLKLGELADNEEDSVGVRTIVNAFRCGTVRLPCIDVHSLVVN